MIVFSKKYSNILEEKEKNIIFAAVLIANHNNYGKKRKEQKERSKDV